MNKNQNRVYETASNVLYIFITNLIIFSILSCHKKQPVQEGLNISIIPYDSATIKPTLISIPEIEYPDLPRRAGIEGTAKIKCVIDTDGLVIDVKLIKSSANDILDSAAISACKFLKFSPGEFNNRKIRVSKEVSVKFYDFLNGKIKIVE